MWNDQHVAWTKVVAAVACGAFAAYVLIGGADAVRR